MGGVASKIKKSSFLLQCKMWEKSWAARLDKPEQFVIVPAFQLGMCPNILSLENRQKCGKRGWNFHVVIKKYLTHFFFFSRVKIQIQLSQFFSMRALWHENYREGNKWQFDKKKAKTLDGRSHKIGHDHKSSVHQFCGYFLYRVAK